MKNKLFLAGMLGMILTFGILTISCEDERDLRYSVQVNNRAASRAIAAEDTVELYIHHLEYEEDANNRALIIIAANDRDQGSKGGKLNNAGWYSVTADLDVTNDVNDGPYSVFLIGISKLKVDGTEYEFPHILEGVLFGNSSRWASSGLQTYPDNFNGITIDSSTVSLKTVLTVEPDIIDCWDQDGNLIQDADPYKFIKVEGRINE